MCGILGFISRKGIGIDDAHIIDPLRLLNHRGPDSSQAILFSNDPSKETPRIRNIRFKSDFDVLLCHTRLSIIDTSQAGSQPMSNEDGSIWLAYNGEIYNFPELKDTLKKKHAFRSDTDTEVMIHAYEEYGDSFVEKLNGMFAFIMLDLTRKKILIGRDPIGIKPLYFYEGRDELIISSELRPILNMMGKTFSLDRQSLRDYLCIGYIPTPGTPFKEIKKIEPSEYLAIDLSGAKADLSEKRYWNIRKPDKQDQTEEKLLLDLNSILFSSVNGCLISDVPLGIFLSGGTDSTVITYIASKIKESPIRTFSVGFKDKDYDESGYSLEVSRICKTSHSHYYVDEDFLGYLPEVVFSTEEPIADPASIPLYFLSREARKEVKVVLSGEGGDEIFGGYTRYFWDKMGRTYENLPKSLRKIISSIAKIVPDSGGQTTLDTGRRIKKFFKTGSLPNIERYLSWFLIFDDLNGLLGKNTPEDTDGGSLARTFEKHYMSFEGGDHLQRTQFLDLRTMLLDNLLLKADKLSMAHSLEVRVPLLDKRIVEFALNLEPSMKVNYGETKYLLKNYLKGKIPDFIFRRRKQGFEMPIGRWLKEKDWANTKKKILRLSNFFNILESDTLNKTIVEHENGRSDQGRKIYSLLVLSIWLDKYMPFTKPENIC